MSTHLTPYLDPLPIPKTLTPVSTAGGVHRYCVEMKAAHVRLHSEIAHPTLIWGYDGQYPGPTIEARRDQPVAVEWVNQLTGPHPVRRFLGNPDTDADPTATTETEPGQNDRGAFGPDAPYPAWTVVHLHGGRVPPDSDGWPDNAYFPGGSQRCLYPNGQRAALLWYHDHAMGLTGPNVFAGLAGLYLVRDPEEDNLRDNCHLPSGPYEIPLLIQGRNLDLDDAGDFTGALLYKLDGELSEFYGPYTLVNGKIWPHLEVEPRQYRLRVINGANARFLCLNLFAGGDDAGTAANGLVQQIGAEGGLMAAPVALPPGGLLLAPAERADLVVDFSGREGQTLTWINSAPAPFPGGGKEGDNTQVMQFRVVKPLSGTFTPFAPPTPLSHVEKLTHDIPHAHVPVALTETPPGSGMVLLNGADFHGAMTPDEFIDYGEFRVWKVSNHTDDTHPLHIHLVQFQVLRREILDQSKESPVPVVVDANESGCWKDVVRVNPNEVVTLMARFDGFTGRYMYHCHILEHEDHTMMRTFIVLPKSVPMFGMNGDGMNGGMAGMPAG